MSNSFLKTNEAQNILVLDYYGYKLTERQGELTRPQELFLLIGKVEFDKKINKVKE